jgi:hypothetical protein
MPFLYSTLVGGADLAKVNDITIDSLGNAYLTGRTRSPDFPTERAFDSSFNAAYPGLSDCFVLKVNSTGNGIVYSTFIGGIAADGGEAIEVDSLGNVYVGGTTTSPDFPTKSALDDSYSESTDCFLLKLNASGSGLVYSTFVGGLLWEVVNDIVIDSSSNLYAVGFTASGDFPTVNAFDASHGGSHEGFVLKLNATGNGLFYSTFIGGNSTDSVTAVTEGPSGTLYITGHTISPDFPIVNGINSSLNGLGDCFVARLNSSGGVMYSTFIGGGMWESGQAIEVDADGAMYIAGHTRSPDFPLVNPFDSDFAGEKECFVLKLNATGDGALFSTYVGGSGDECGNSIALGPDGNVFVAGETGSVDFPLVNPIGDSYGGGDSDGFVFKMRDLSDSDGDGLPDWWEIQYGLDHTSGDSQLDPDSDELSNLEEYQYGTNPVSNDTDSDGMSDGWEVFNLLDPLENDATQDVDLDGLTNLEEYRFGTNPHSNDTDSDNMPDEWEVRNGLNASAYDAFADPDSDGLSNMEEYQIGTHPNNNDTDSDGIPDGWEVTFGLDPLDSDSEEDNDLDGLTNLREFESGTDPFDNDSDSDGFLDGWEVHWGFDPMDPAVPLVELLAYNILGITAIVSIVTTVALTLVLGVKLQEKAKKRAKQEREEEVQRALVDLTESKRESA